MNMCWEYYNQNSILKGEIVNLCDISHYVGTIPVGHVVNSSIIYVHILPYHTLVLYLYMYLSEMTFLTNSSYHIDH
jgi:hypothetical protein